MNNIVIGCQSQDLHDFLNNERPGTQDQTWQQIRCETHTHREWLSNINPPLPDYGCVDLILPVLENSLLCRLLLIIRLLQLDLEKGGRGMISNLSLIHI